MPTTRRKGSSSTTSMVGLAAGTGSTGVADGTGGQVCDNCGPTSRACDRQISGRSDQGGSSAPAVPAADRYALTQCRTAAIRYHRDENKCGRPELQRGGPTGRVTWPSVDVISC